MLPSQAPSIHRFWRTWKSIKLAAFHLALHFFFRVIPEGLSESVMTTKAADLRDSPRRRKKDRCTQTYSWKCCQQQLGKWQALTWVTTPPSAGMNLKEECSLDFLWLPRLPFISLLDTKEKETVPLHQWQVSYRYTFCKNISVIPYIFPLFILI